jgi:hypothetical protein
MAAGSADLGHGTSHVKTVAPCKRSSQRSAFANGSVRQRHVPRLVLRNARP